MTTTEWNPSLAAGAGITGGFRTRARSLHQALIAWHEARRTQRLIAEMDDRMRSDIGLSPRSAGPETPSGLMRS
ncbi:DUF1127 domain-containing protein [Muricoccus radiodurans]|uniref:DUF1127 domain-containing protein n=1 Tax=Muricoccus radiodurans TaxID=2231721 RepID=UPI003CF409FB